MNSTCSMLDIISSIKNNDYEEKKKLQEQLKDLEMKIEKMKNCQNCNHKYCEGNNVEVIKKFKNCFDNKYKYWELSEN